MRCFEDNFTVFRQLVLFKFTKWAFQRFFDGSVADAARSSSTVLKNRKKKLMESKCQVRFALDFPKIRIWKEKLSHKSFFPYKVNSFCVNFLIHTFSRFIWPESERCRIRQFIHWHEWCDSPVFASWRSSRAEERGRNLRMHLRRFGQNDEHCQAKEAALFGDWRVS